MAELREERIDVGGRETSYLTAGDGEPLVFFHGGGIVEGFECFTPLAERYRFIAPFHPGFGATAIDPAAGNIDDLVDHYERFFKALGLDSFALAGHSLGGWIAASYASAHPERVKRLVVAAPYGLNVPEHPNANVFAMEPAEMYAALTNDQSVWEGRMPTTPEEEQAFGEARALEGRSIGGFVPGPFDPSLPAKLEALPMPVLILWGDDDKIVSPGAQPAWQSHLPEAGSRSFPGVGHLLFHEDRAAVDAIGDFAAKT